GRTDRDGARPGLGLPPGELPQGIHERRLGLLEPHAVGHGLLRPLERGHPRRALPDPRCARRPHRAGRRARLLRGLLDGRRAALLARRYHPPAQTRAGGLTVTHRLLRGLGALAVAAAICTPSLADEPGPGGTKPLVPKTGEEVYRFVCQACHMAD